MASGRKGGFVGTVPLGAGAGEFALPLTAVPDGAFGSALLTLTFSGVQTYNSGSAFAVSYTGLAEPQGPAFANQTVDDVQVLLNDALSDLTFYIDGGNYLFSKMAIADVRSLLMFMNGGQDVQGTFLSATIPDGSTKSFTIEFLIPFALARYLVPEGMISAQGAERLRDGGQLVVGAAKQANTDLALAAGNMVYTGWTATLAMVPSLGDSSLVGPIWQADLVSGLPNSYSPRQALWALIAQKYTTTAVPAQGVTITGQADERLVDFTYLAAKYLGDHLPIGGKSSQDPTQNFGPAIWLARDADVLSMPDPQESTILEPSQTTLALMMVELKGVSPSAAQNAAASVSDGQVVERHPAVPSLQPGSTVPANKVALIPSTFHAPGTTTGVVHASPAAVAAAKVTRNLQAAVGAAAAPAVAAASPSARTAVLGRGARF